MTALQSATKSLLTQLQTAATNNGDVYVSIVPFVKDVNLGAPFTGTTRRNPTTIPGTPTTAPAAFRATRPETLASRSRPARFRATPPRAPAPARALARFRATIVRAAARLRALARFRASPARAPARARAFARMVPKRPKAPARAIKPAPNRNTRRKTIARKMAGPGALARGRTACGPRPHGRRGSGPRRRGHPITTAPGPDVSGIAAIRAAPTPSLIMIPMSVRRT